jgi:predicted lipoprotein with Yx(FWY)xxD motif
MIDRWKSLGLLSAALFLVACGGSTANPGTASSSPTVAPTVAPVVKTATATVGGKSETILVGANGMTLYRYAPDKGGKITCLAACAANWPPLFLPSGQTTVSATSDLKGTFTTLPSPEGKGTQVLYNGWPLYYWVKDKQPGDTTGEGVGGKWFTATPDQAAG